MSIRFAGGADHGGNRAVGDDGMTSIMDPGVIECAFDKSFKAVHARGMGKGLL